MRVVIPAAGESRRLRPLTNQFPKTLLSVGEKSILHHIVEACAANGLTDFHLLVGHGAEQVIEYCEQLRTDLSSDYPGITFQFIQVPDYQTKGNIWSVFQASPLFDEDFILVNSDTLVHPDIIKSLLDSPEPRVLAVDDGKKLGEEEMKVIVEDGVIKQIHKSLDPETAHGEYIGAMKISGGAQAQLRQAFEEKIAENSSLYYEDALQQAFNAGLAFGMISTNGLPNMEIDTPEDLKNAEQVAAAIRQALCQ